MHATAHFLAQPFQVGRRGATGVDQKIAVFCGDLCGTTKKATAAGIVDQLPRARTIRVAKSRAAGCVP